MQYFPYNLFDSNKITKYGKRRIGYFKLQRTAHNNPSLRTSGYSSQLRGLSVSSCLNTDWSIRFLNSWGMNMYQWVR